jgi:hypothetical protein
VSGSYIVCVLTVEIYHNKLYLHVPFRVVSVNMMEFQKIAEVIRDWYFERGTAKMIDCVCPCDSTCHNIISSDHVSFSS